MKRIGIGAGVVVSLVFAAAYWLAQGGLGSLETAGEPTNTARAADDVAHAVERQRRAAERIGAGAGGARQILFGDLHVHTTFSTDAFLISLPATQGEGSRPPADACDFARFCSALDFWSINDHAEGLTPRQWRETVESLRQCDAVAGSGPLPDTVPFLGWEWTQVGQRPEDHYGHKNVVLRGLADDEIPARPIASAGLTQRAGTPPGWLTRAGLAAWTISDARMQDLVRFLAERAANVPCADDVASPDLPADCVESAPTPADLFRKLNEWDVDALVIPHGTAWGFYTPPGASWDKQLEGAHFDPERQNLVEIFSGHGNSESYRDWRAVEFDAEGRPSCPAPAPNYVPSCWRAGEIIEARCLEAGEPASECSRRAAEARQWAAEAGVAGHHVVQGESPDEWLDAGQCRDCFLPPFNHRPGGSVQYMLALQNFAEPDGPRRFRFGFLGSSDNHFARPGTGYKEVHREGMTESRGGSRDTNSLLRGDPEEPIAEAKPLDPNDPGMPVFRMVELERQASFFVTGGLVAAHATGRDRDAVWQALRRKEVYGTSGPRILLWFDLLNDPSGVPLPMGGSARLNEAPQFQVRAVGSFEQQPGCPPDRLQALSPERVADLCKGECYHPSDVRRPITRIEIVRIRPQARADEAIAPLIEDPWRTFPCDGDPAGCTVAFDDPDFTDARRDALYYARAIEAPSDAVNGGQLRCETDAEGNCLRVNRCATPETRGDDDCLAEVEERAWSSPIFVDWRGETP
ncbi:MAG: DUF3604 domain-containing protein [Proteobacteria bacterium]|nr:DUF3604 domain-containing protein [Pseudomonadota bacterium]